MAAFTLSAAVHSASSLRIFPNCSPSRNIYTSSFYSLPCPSLLFSSKLLKLRSPLNHRHPSFVASAVKKLADSELVAVSSESDGIFPSDSGVYAVYDGNGDLQFVGITRNLAASVLTHKKSVPELCCSVKVSNLLFFFSFRNTIGFTILSTHGLIANFGHTGRLRSFI